jgi:CrcB protein
MGTLLAVAAGGALGAMGRFLVVSGFVHLLGTGFPYGTLVANVVGSFLMGLLVETVALTGDLSNELRAFLAVGVLGGFTTFSAFSLDAAVLGQRGDLGLAALYVTGSVVLAIAALFAGIWAARAVLA